MEAVWFLLIGVLVAQVLQFIREILIERRREAQADRAAKVKAESEATALARTTRQARRLVADELDTMANHLAMLRTPYALRHSFATEAIHALVPSFIIARVMGTSEAMLRKHYGHLLPDTDDLVRERLDAYAATEGKWRLSVEARSSGL